MERTKEYLKDRINNWYYNSKIDYNVEGEFIDLEVEGHKLIITFKEMGETLKCTIGYFADYNDEQLYNIWMEFGADED